MDTNTNNTNETPPETEGRGDEGLTDMQREHPGMPYYPPGATPRVSYRHLIKLFLAMIALIIVAVGLLGVWLWYADGARDTDADDRYRQFMEAQNKYIQAMTEDTYGGTTPQETLDMFVEALRNDDIELASKYFALNDETLDRKKWEDALAQVRDERRTMEVVETLQRAQPSSRPQTTEQRFQFMVLGEDGMAEATVYMKFNSLSGVWKIEGM